MLHLQRTLLEKGYTEAALHPQLEINKRVRSVLPLNCSFLYGEIPVIRSFITYGLRHFQYIHYLLSIEYVPLLNAFPISGPFILGIYFLFPIVGGYY